MNVKESIAKLQQLPEKRKKIIFFSILGVLAVAGLIWWITSLEKSIPKIVKGFSDGSFLPPMPEQTTIDTSAKTYTSNVYGFSMQYPGSWKINENDNDISFASADGYPIDVFIQSNPNHLSAKEYDQRLITDNETIKDGPKMSYKNAYETTVNSYPAYELSGVFGGDRNEEKITIASQDYIYIVSFPTAEANPNFSVDMASYNQMAHQIINTFKFTN